MGKSETLQDGTGDINFMTVDEGLVHAVQSGNLKLIADMVRAGANVFYEVEHDSGFKKGDTIWDFLRTNQKLGDKSSDEVRSALVKAYSEHNNINKEPDEVLTDIYSELCRRRKVKQIEAMMKDHKRNQR